jgi:hypothetical protein
MGSASLWIRVEDTPSGERWGGLTPAATHLYGCASRLPDTQPAPDEQSRKMTDLEKIRAILTDVHFLIPLIVFGIGLALLITLH